jgi:hypothetical protein
MFAMTSPVKSSKVLLVVARRAEGVASAAIPVRRYRLARLRVPASPQGAARKAPRLFDKP